MAGGGAPSLLGVGPSQEISWLSQENPSMASKMKGYCVIVFRNM